jgi:hypothetical protein
MAESLQHLKLVRAILSYISREHHEVSYLATLHDLPGFIGGEKPPRIGRFTPDVYAVDAPHTVTIIGEAKTVPDLETDHSRKQIRVFIEFLKDKERGVFVLAVPWQAAPRARGIVSGLAQGVGSPSTKLVVLDGSDTRRTDGC